MLPTIEIDLKHFKIDDSYLAEGHLINFDDLLLEAERATATIDQFLTHAVANCILEQHVKNRFTILWTTSTFGINLGVCSVVNDLSSSWFGGLESYIGYESRKLFSTDSSCYLHYDGQTLFRIFDTSGMGTTPRADKKYYSNLATMIAIETAECPDELYQSICRSPLDYPRLAAFPNSDIEWSVRGDLGFIPIRHRFGRIS
jgi:hypothetical protein